jgi:hypothetical protein
VSSQRNNWYERATFMREVGATHAAWAEETSELLSLTLAPQAPRPAQPPAAPKGPAAKLASAFADKLKREHETRFAASHFKPRLDVPTVSDNVPRAVRDREAERGASNKSKRR